MWGKGNPESFNSCSHGAGRAMSRRQAREQFSIEDHAKATAGAYKSIDAVITAQADLVGVVHALNQMVCVKG